MRIPKTRDEKKRKKKLYDTPSEESSESDRERRRKRQRAVNNPQRQGLEELRRRKEAAKKGTSVVISSNDSSNSDSEGAIEVSSEDLDKNISGFIEHDTGSDLPVELPALYSKGRMYELPESLAQAVRFYCMTHFYVGDFPAHVREGDDTDLVRDILEPVEDLLSKISKRKDTIPETLWPVDFRKALDYYPRIERVPVPSSKVYKDVCVACQKKQTIAYTVTLGGAPYDPFSIVSRKEQEERDHEPSIKYPKKAPHKGPYPLGQSCMDKVERYHSLAHALYVVRSQAVFECKDYWMRFEKNPPVASDRKRLEKNGVEDFFKDHWGSLADAALKR